MSERKRIGITLYQNCAASGHTHTCEGKKDSKNIKHVPEREKEREKKANQKAKPEALSE
jgi:hypothetical protein